MVQIADCRWQIISLQPLHTATLALRKTLNAWAGTSGNHAQADGTLLSVQEVHLLNTYRVFPGGKLQPTDTPWRI